MYTASRRMSCLGHPMCLDLPLCLTTPRHYSGLKQSVTLLPTYTPGRAADVRGPYNLGNIKSNRGPRSGWVRAPVIRSLSPSPSPRRHSALSRPHTRFSISNARDTSRMFLLAILSSEMPRPRNHHSMLVTIVAAAGAAVASWTTGEHRLGPCWPISGGRPKQLKCSPILKRTVTITSGHCLEAVRLD